MIIQTRKNHLCFLLNSFEIVIAKANCDSLVFLKVLLAAALIDSISFLDSVLIPIQNEISVSPSNDLKVLSQERA